MESVSSIQENNLLVSVIVPVYNTPAPYLERCIGSLINQTFTNLEIILIDDGSAQECAEQCDVIARQYSQVVVIHQANAGVSAARNRALNVMQGDYFTFVDPDDDLCSLSCVEEAINIAIATEADIVMGGVVRQFANSRVVEPFGFLGEDVYRVYKMQENVGIFRKQFLSFAVPVSSDLPSSLMRGAACKFFKRKTVSLVRFDEGVVCGEDMLFNVDAISYSNTIVLVDRIWYTYYQYQGSAARLTDFSECKEQSEGCLNHISPSEEDVRWAYYIHCILSTCFSVCRKQGMSAYSQLKTFITQSWVCEAFDKFRQEDYALPAWEKLLVGLAKKKRNKLFCWAVLIGSWLLVVKGKKCIEA